MAPLRDRPIDPRKVALVALYSRELGCARADRSETTMRDAGSVLTDLEEFIAHHRPHGALTGDATEPAWNCYRLTVVFERWVTAMAADADLISWARQS